MCHRSPGIVAARKNFLSAIWFRPDCGSLSCPECLEKYKNKHIKIVCSIFEREQSVWKTTGSGQTQYHAVYMVVYRAGGSYVALDNADGTWTMYSSVCTGTGCWLTSEQAVADIVPAILSIHKPEGLDRYRPISYSKGWRLKKVKSDLVRLGNAVASTFKEILQAIKVTVKDKVVHGRDILYGKTDEFLVQDIKNLLEHKFDREYWANYSFRSSRGNASIHNEQPKTDCHSSEDDWNDAFPSCRGGLSGLSTV